MMADDGWTKETFKPGDELCSDPPLSEVRRIPMGDRPDQESRRDGGNAILAASGFRELLPAR